MNNTHQKKPRKEAQRGKLFARIMALFLALLMVGGAAYYLIYMLIFAVSATETAVQPLAEDINIRVGLKYDDGVPTSFETTTKNGYTIGVLPLSDGQFDYAPFWELEAATVAVAVDANLKKTDKGYEPTLDPTVTTVGGYHIELAIDYALIHADSIRQQIIALDEWLAAAGMYTIPTYINGVLRLRTGCFSTEMAAENIRAAVASYMPEVHSYVVSPSETGVVVIDPATDRILFCYDNADGTALGMAPREYGDETVYLKTSVGNVYDGAFAYKRHRDEGINGVAVTNVLTLDQYVQGVVPYEIGNTWPIETQKAFAIAVRSYAAGSLNRHNSAHGFDLCNSSHCQAYRGAGRVNEDVIIATESTHGLIITSKGKIVSTFYSSSFGGHSVSLGDVWGGASSECLVAHATPWENYSKHTNGFWTVEVSPTELLNYLVETKGYSELAGGSYISKIEVVAYAPSSTYVKTLRITAANGKSITLNNTATVHSKLSRYLKSANFVVGQGSVNYTLETVEIVGERVIDSTTDRYVLAPVNGTSTAVTSEGFISVNDPVSVLTSATQETTVLAGATVLTASGEQSVDADNALVLTKDNAAAYAGGTLKEPASGSALQRTVKEYTVHTENKVAVASSPQNFIFVGKGSGHGTGMSQYGAMDLGELGYDYGQIINAYFTGVEIVYYKELEVFKNR